MADEVFDFDDSELSSKLTSQLKLSLQKSHTENSLIEQQDKLPELKEPQVQTFPKHRSNSVISVGSIDNRLGTSYKVNLDEVYDAEITDSREPSVTNFLSPDSPLNNKTTKKTLKKMEIQNFQPITVLGKGSYGKVILVKDKKTGKLYAQKQLKKASMIVNASNYERTLTERTILQKVDHPNIVKLFYALQDFDKVYLLLEYLQGGELFHHLMQERIISEKVACFYVGEMILALKHLHTNAGVIYRDLKPENCMLNSKGHLVLTDFGLSKVSDECHSMFGTAQYMAPEIIRGEKYDSQCDWFSLGAVMFDMLTGSPPFTGNNNKKIMDKILTQKVKYPFYLSQEAKDLLAKLLNKNPKKRINCDTEFETKIRKHRFFRFIKWDYLIKQDDDEQPPPIIPIITDPELAENFDDEFTSMRITPPSSPIKESMFDHFEESRTNSTSSFIAIKRPDQNGDVKESVYFNNFSYTNESLFMN